MPWRYSVFGLRVEADRSIPGLAPASSQAPADIEIRTSGFPAQDTGDEARQEYESPTRGQRGQPLLRVWKLSGDRIFRLLYDDGAEFWIERGGHRIWCRWPPTLTIDEVCPYLQGPILGFALRLRGVTSLHASAVEVDRRAIVMLGPPEAGKSTTAAALARRGHGVLSDDIVAVTEEGEEFWVSPGYPWIRLWPASVEALFGSPTALPRISPMDASWDKCFLDLTSEGYSFVSEPLPLGAIYILQERTMGEGAPAVVPTSAPVRLLSLAGNTYLNYLLDKKVRAQEFRFLGRMARRVPVRVVVPHASGDRLDSLCDVILEDYARLNGAAGSTEKQARPVRRPHAGSGP